MKPLGVVLLAAVTSIATTVGALYAAHRYRHLLATQEQPQPAPRKVPELVGLTEADARKNLEALGLKLLIAGREARAGAEEGTVVAQSPGPGELAGPDGAVSLTLALALPKVPDVVGKPVADATATLEKAGYAVTIGKAVPSDEHEKDVVVSQSPAAGSPLKNKEKVELQPSAGRAAVEVPKLLGLGMEAAKKEAEKANLELVVQWVALAETATYVVLRQNPLPGQSVQPSSKVTVFVNR